MASTEVLGFDDKSQLWLQPFSEIINCMFPVEYVYGEWIWWQAISEAKRSFNPESLAATSSSETETGSRVEGFCIPQILFSEVDEGFLPLDQRKHWQPDLDVMKVDACSCTNDNNEVLPIFTVEHEADDPRYIHLRFTDEWRAYKPKYKNATFINHTYLLPSKEFWLDKNEVWTYEMHGPVRKLENKGFVHFEEDQTGVFKYPLAWPEPAMEWLVRPRNNGWPSPDLLQDILESGCHLAPVGRGRRQDEPMALLDYAKNPEQASSSCWKAEQENPKAHTVMDETEWRLSFSVAENKLGQSVSPVQRHVLVLLKMIKKVYFPDTISSYLLKNLLFWEIENQEPSFWKEADSGKCLVLMLDRLQKSLEEGHLPHYIIPHSNLLQNEDPAKLAEAAAVVGDVRKTILSKVVSLLKRCMSLTYQSQIYLVNLQDLEPLLLQVQDKSLTEEDAERLITRLLVVFVKKSKDVIKNLFENLEKEGEDEIIKKMMYIPLNAYRSLLARALCKIWFLKIAHKKDKEATKENFLSSIKEEVSHLAMDEDFFKLAEIFFGEIDEGRDMSLIIPNTTAMKQTKDVYKELAWHQVGQAQAPVDEQIGWFKRSDMEVITSKVSEKMKGRLENLTLEEIKAELDKELKLLHEKRHQKDPEKDATDDESG